jgi:cytidylate kinase
MEGRYLGFFARDYNDVLTVWVHSNLASRSARCLEREDSISSLEEAVNHIVDRDSCEKGIGNELYGLADFTNPSQFARLFENSDEEDRENIISALIGIVIPGTQASE